MIESFTFDHTTVKRVPYVRLSKQIDIEDSGKVLLKYDMRFCMPNKAFLPMDVMHAMEHILSGELDAWCEREGITYVDLSPMGCQTGFYLCIICDASDAQVKASEAALCAPMDEVCKKLLGYDSVPFASEETCGNWRSFNLEGAKTACTLPGFVPFAQAIAP